MRYAAGGEDYLTFGGDTEHPAAGEVIFADRAGRAHARRWTNRQSGLSAVRDATAAVLIVAEALHEKAASDVRELTATLAAEIGAVWSVTPSAALLAPAEPRFTFGAPGRYASPVRQANPSTPPPQPSYPRAASGRDPARVSSACSASWTGFGWPARPR